MKEMSLADLRTLSADDLKGRESDLRGQLFQLKMTKHTSTLPDPMLIRKTRRDIARVLTVIGERAGAKE